MTNAMELGAFKYSSGEFPQNYACDRCGVTGVKLWRLYQTFMENQELTCARCSCAAEKRDITDIDERGAILYRGHRCDHIGWRIPAVPTEDGESLWGYTSVPQDGVGWWRALPNEVVSC